MNINRTTWLAAAAFAALSASSASAQIIKTDHNFSSYAWSDGEICKPCHTPHFANQLAGRLWNHELTTATYTMHKGDGTAELNLDKRSRLCLGCHDGTVALDSFGGKTGENYMPGDGLVGKDLSNDHPIGSDAIYDVGNAYMKDPGGLPSALRLRDWTDANGVVHKVVSCGTCHTPHGKGFDHLLNMSNGQSAICMSCHIK
jgi:predicted CXXCH cytochrome family protein